MSGCPKSREKIAEELTLRVRRANPITVSMLNDWTKTTKTAARFPAAYVRDFCEVTGSDKLQRAILGSRLSDLIEIGERELDSQKTRSAKDTVLKRLLTADVQKPH
jgi:hypothetical protein